MTRYVVAALIPGREFCRLGEIEADCELSPELAMLALDRLSRTIGVRSDGTLLACYPDHQSNEAIQGFGGILHWRRRKPILELFELPITAPPMTYRAASTIPS